MEENNYIVMGRFGSGHDFYIGEIKANSTKKAFKKSVIKYFNPLKYDKYKSFFVVQSNKDDSDFYSYGYAEGGQNGVYNGFRTSLKSIIEEILLSEAPRKSTEGFQLK